MFCSRRVRHAVLSFITVMSLFFATVSCSSQGYSGPVEPITVGPSSAVGINTYITVAQEQQFFARNGLNVTVSSNYTEGLDALNGLLQGDIAFAGSSEYPVVGKAFNHDDVRIIATLNQGGTFFLVARKDRGIESITDLKGKRIGVTFKTINEFYLGRFLNLNGIQIREVTLVNFKLAQLEEALGNNEEALGNNSVDAVVVREPSLSSIRKRFGAETVSWSVQSSQPTYGVISSTGAWIKQHPELVKRLLQSLAQAEEYINTHPAETETVLIRQLNNDKEALASFQTGLQFSLSLDQPLITAMEDEARWMMRNNLTDEKIMPDFLKYINVDALKAVKPEAVNIIR